MGLIDVVDAYRLVDLSYIAAGDEDSTHYACDILNFHKSALEQLSNGLWFSNDFLLFFRENQRRFSFSKRKDLKVKEFGLYGIVEEVEEEVDYEYFLIARNPADALKTVVDLNIEEPESYSSFEVLPFSKSLTFTENAVLKFSKALQSQNIIEN